MADRLIVDADQGTCSINRNVYGHFAEHLGHCIYGGIWVGEGSEIPNIRGLRTDVVKALRRIRVPVLRWPGGCFADEYHWRDGIGPRSDRPCMVNTHWGGVTENNHFGTHEFLDLCEQVGATPYVCGNVGSGTVQELQQWVEYITFDGRSPMADLRRANGREEPWPLPYVGIGNESWGCGGNMRPEYYSDVYRRYQTYVRDFGANRVFKIAAGANVDDYHWTEVLMREATCRMDGLSLHYYTMSGRDWQHKGSATGFGEDVWFTTMRQCLRMDELIQRHSTIMDRYDPQRRVAMVVDEWGTWHDVEPGTDPGFLYQQNTLRDALVAGLTLNIFNNRADRVRMANLAQLVNVLQAPILTDGARMLTTPTYHVFDLYKDHQDAVMLPSHLECGTYDLAGEHIPRLSASASRDATGHILLTLCNVDPHHEVDVACELRGAKVTEVVAMALTAERMQAQNTFSNPDAVVPVAFDAARIEQYGVPLVLPPMSVVAVRVLVVP
jgi:alpha-N-arabinofuranosidase